MARMKPLPKFILIIAAAGAVAYGISFALSLRKPAEAPAAPVVATPVPAESTQVTAPPPNAATPPVAQASEPAPAAPLLTPATQPDAGVANVLRSVK